MVCFWLREEEGAAVEGTAGLTSLTLLQPHHLRYQRLVRGSAPVSRYQYSHCALPFLRFYGIHLDCEGPDPASATAAFLHPIPFSTELAFYSGTAPLSSISSRRQPRQLLRHRVAIRPVRRDDNGIVEQVNDYLHQLHVLHKNVATPRLLRLGCANPTTCPAAAQPIIVLCRTDCALDNTKHPTEPLIPVH